MRIDIDVFGVETVRSDLLRFEDRADSPGPFLAAVAQDFYELQERAFATEGASSGGRWAPLSPRYATHKASRYPGKTILRRTDALYRSLTGPFSEFSTFRLTDDEVLMATRHPAAVPHAQGTSRMPARPPVRLRDIDRRRWLKGLQRYLIEGDINLGVGL